RGAANSPAKPPATPERIEAILQLRELGRKIIRSPRGTATSSRRSQCHRIASSEPRDMGVQRSRSGPNGQPPGSSQLAKLADFRAVFVTLTKIDRKSSSRASQPKVT